MMEFIPEAGSNSLPGSRRRFLKHMTLGGCLALSQGDLSAETGPGMDRVKLKPGNVILFQGDSITDSVRNRSIKDANNLEALGYGYAYLCALSLLCNHAEKSLSIYNRGISGNKVTDLAGRWEEDCLSIRPDLISILIGVNDFWSTLKGDNTNAAGSFLRKYEELLDKTRQRLPEAAIILCEPFAVKGVMYVDETWFPGFKDYQHAVQETASRYKAVFIPFQSYFDKAQTKADGAYWAVDGVHPTLAGHQLMSQSWLKMIK